MNTEGTAKQAIITEGTGTDRSSVIKGEETFESTQHVTLNTFKPQNDVSIEEGIEGGMGVSRNDASDDV